MIDADLLLNGRVEFILFEEKYVVGHKNDTYLWLRSAVTADSKLVNQVANSNQRFTIVSFFSVCPITEGWPSTPSSPCTFQGEAYQQIFVEKIEFWFSYFPFYCDENAKL